MEKDTRNAIVIILLVAAGIVGAVFGSTVEFGYKGDGEWPPDREEIERSDPTIYLTIGTAVATVNLVIAVLLIVLYFQVYKEVKSDFTIGLIVVMFSFLLYALFSNPMIHDLFGFRAIGIGPFAWIPNLFAMVAMFILLYLSLE
jgi:hypothetical protein